MNHIITSAVLVTVFNRKQVTLRGLETLYFAIGKMHKSSQFDIYVVDDGCTDGTGEAIRERFPKVKIIESNGGLFWGGGMNLAWRTAASMKDYDYYLWLNDDAELYPNAIQLLYDISNQEGENVLVSGVFEDLNHKISYGGKAMNKKLLPPGTSEEIIFMNGNLVLIPKRIFKKLGYLDDKFIHGGGDYDYGLRAREAGFNIKLTNEIVGKTSRHDEKAHYRNDISLIKRIKLLYCKKNNPYTASKLYYRHFGLRNAIQVFFRRNMRTFFPSK